VTTKSRRNKKRLARRAVEIPLIDGKPVLHKNLKDVLVFESVYSMPSTLKSR
jgi:hypothetical protein